MSRTPPRTFGQTDPAANPGTGSIVTLVSTQSTPARRRQAIHTARQTIASTGPNELPFTVLGEVIHQVPSQYFLDRLLPRLPADVEVNQVVECLQRPGESGSAQHHNGRFTLFPTDPAHDPSSESSVFSKLAVLAQVIHEVSAMPNDRRTTVFRCNPDATPSPLVLETVRV